MEVFIDKMIRKVQKIPKKYYPLMAFGFTGLLTILLFIYTGLMPGGTKSILVSDLYGQYYDFLKGFRSMIIEGNSIWYSWNMGMGLSTIGWFSYYVSSPLNILLLLFPEKYVLYGVTFLIILKLCLSAMTMCMYLKKTLKQDGMEVIIFSCFYAMCGYGITYYFNIMWLDGLLLLPLVLLQVGKLIDTKKMPGLVGILALLFFSNYYIGYMIGVFSIIYFISYYSYQKPFQTKEFVGAFLRFVGSAVIAAFMNGVILLPSFLQIMNLHGETERRIESMFLKFHLVDWYHNLFAGSYTTLEAGKPLIYTGVITLCIVPLFFLNHQISKKEKKLIGMMLSLLVVTMGIPLTDLLMHAGAEPTWFLYRYSFIISFLLAVIGCREFVFLKKENPKKVFAVLGLNGIYLSVMYFIVLATGNSTMDMDIVKFILNIMLIGAYGLLYYYAKIKKGLKKDVYAALIFLVSLELVLNGYLTIDHIDKEVSYRDTEEIIEEKELTTQELDKLEEDTFYRIEKNYTATLNDSLGEGYKGVASFSSIYNKPMNKFMYSMGIWVHEWQTKYCGSTEMTNSLFNVKKVFHRKKKDLFHVSNQEAQEDFYIEENKFYLPIGFMVDEGANQYDFIHRKSTDVVKNQQELLGALLGKEEAKSCFVKVKPEKLELENVEVIREENQIIYRRIDKEREATITYYITKEKDLASYYFYFQYDNSDDNKQKLLLNTETTNKLKSNFVEIQTCQVPFNLNLTGDNMIGQGEEIKVTVDFYEEDQFVIEDEIFYYIDLEQYQEYYQELNQNTLEVTKYDNTSLQGTITVEDKTLLYTSIPYDRGWKAKVDGIKTEITPLFQNAVIGLSLTEGDHVIAFEFCPEGGKLGGLLSVVGCFSFLIIIWLNYKKR